ncbi:hypothetical protein [Salibacter halophilus]|uniref:Uncharacterized protein n=1 Tax=Salibacter halophilus TaxID=1803916 RepID=A0A6N6M9M5_9FLAO|nr:hypothetical protein [Salibacter halophilus]KAB1064922.1 hypothetical protein F3059_06095 [Salibacter halophilus]
MKYFTLMIAALLMFAACDKDEEDQQPLADEAYMKADVNGREVNADYKVILQDIIFNSYAPEDSLVQFQRFVANQNPEGFFATLHKTNLDALNYPHTFYPSSKDVQRVDFIYYDTKNAVYTHNILDSTEFSLTINSHNSKDVIIGTFSGMLYNQNRDSVNITNGKFEIDLKKY